MTVDTKKPTPKHWCTDPVGAYSDWKQTDAQKHMLEHHQHYHLAKKIAGTSTERCNLAEKLANATPFTPHPDFDTYDLAQMQESAESLGTIDVFPVKIVPVVVQAFAQLATTPAALKQACEASHEPTFDTHLSFVVTSCIKAPRYTSPSLKSLHKCPSCRVHFQRSSTDAASTAACRLCAVTAASPQPSTKHAPSAAHVIDDADVGVAISDTVANESARRAATILVHDVPPFAMPTAAIAHMEKATGQSWSDEQRRTFTFAAALVIRIFLSTGRNRAPLPPQFRSRPNTLLLKMGLASADAPCTAFVSGQGGSGKSTVIKAVLAFAAAWGIADLVQASAYIGTAAVAIGGVTVIKHTQAKKKYKNFNAPVKNQMLHIIDEVSLMGQADLNRIDRSLRILRDESNITFGGADVLFIGDHSQLPPVRKCPLWRRPNSHARRIADQPEGSNTKSESDGYITWNSLSHAFFLTHNFRADKDPQYQAFLQRLRIGSLICADYENLAKRFVTKAGLPPIHATHVQHTRKAVAAANHQLVYGAASAARNQLYRMHANVELEDGSVLPSTHAALQGFAVIEDKNDLDPQCSFDFFVGMKVSLPSTNEHIAMGIANGSTAHIVGAVPPLASAKKTVVTHTTPGGSKHTIHVLTHQPAAILVYNPNFDVHFQDYPRGVMPIVPLKKQVKQLPACFMRATITYLPLRHTFSRTCHVLQGATLTAMVLGAICTSIPGWLYTALSRVGSWSALYLYDGLNLTNFMKAGKNICPDKVADVARLQSLSAESFARIVTTP